MQRPSIQRAVARTATVAALAAAVTVPTLGSAPAFASAAAVTVPTLSSAPAFAGPDAHWVYYDSYRSSRDCREAGRDDPEGREWWCDRDDHDRRWLDLSFWESSS
jgi:hypothetical protein